MLVPESIAWMLMASALLVVSAILLLGFVEMAAALGLSAAMPLKETFRLGARRAWLVVLPLAVFACLWLITGDALARLDRNAGRIDAWFVATTGWTGSASVRTAAAWIVAFVRYGIGASLAVALLWALASRGLPGLGTGWARAALSWKRLLAVGLALLAGVWLPWQAVYWRPASRPPTWVQPAFAAIKLLALYVIANAAWAFILRRASR